jgi:hypothetical protein
MADVQFAEHLAEAIGQIAPRGDAVRQAAILFPNRLPIHAVHFGVIEEIALQALYYLLLCFVDLFVGQGMGRGLVDKAVGEGFFPGWPPSIPWKPGKQSERVEPRHNAVHQRDQGNDPAESAAARTSPLTGKWTE